MTRAPRPRRSGESGFALLMVFLMAALIAIMLYRELPRLAFESQRAKEQLLIERGEQYKRAIQLFVKKMNRYPGKIEELENTNNIRFLRKRYKDPMTGKEEWRLIHCGPGGVLTDSVNNKGKAGEKKEENRNTFIAEHAIIGSVVTGPQQSSVALRRRASEGGGQQAGQTDAQGQPGMPVIGPGEMAGPPAMANQQGTPGQPGMPGLPGMPGMVMPGQTGMPGQPQPGQQQTVPGQPGFQPIPIITPGQPFQPGQTQGQQPSVQPQPFIGGSYPGPPVNSQTGGAPAYPTQGYPVQSPGAQQPGMRPLVPGQPGQNEATKLIQQILTSPRPGGMPVSTPGMVGGGMNIGGGIAGVASTLEQDSIMVYGERQKYNEWEFIYDPAKDRTAMGGMAAAPIQGAEGGKTSQPSTGSNPFFNPTVPNMPPTGPAPSPGRRE